MSARSLPLSHLLLAVAVTAVWGTNFVVIRIGLDHLPPLLFATLRFALAFLPAALLLKKPDVPWRRLASYGVLIGAGQFGLLYIAMTEFITPGLASLIVQTQVFWTIGLAMLTTGERPKATQWIAVAVAASGLLLIAIEGGGEATDFGLLLVLGAGLSWALGNSVARRDPHANMLAYVVWSSLFAVPPLLGLSLIVEGPERIQAGLAAADAATWAAVAWQSVGNSLFGYAAWGWLLARHPAVQIAPMALLVPVFGIGASALVLGEDLPLWKLGGAALVMTGLALNIFLPRWITSRA